MAHYEIFKNSRHGAAVSITTVETLGQAEQTLHALAWLEPGDYFTRDCVTGEIVRDKVVRTTAESIGNEARPNCSIGYLS
jgi:hypothetical protein